MQPEGDVIRLFLRLDGHFQVGLPGLSAFLGPSNTEQLQNDLEKNGIKTTRAPLFKFADSKGLQALFWGHDAPAGIRNLTRYFYTMEKKRARLLVLLASTRMRTFKLKLVLSLFLTSRTFLFFLLKWTILSLFPSNASGE